jgi:hypothetical protein
MAARTPLVASLLLGLACALVAVGCGGSGGPGGPGAGGGGGGGAGEALPFPIVYVRQPRFGDGNDTTWPEVFHPARLDPGADLVLLKTDGTEEVLVDAGNGSVTDPFVSFDAQWVYYSYFPDLRPSALNGQRGGLPYAGADVYRVHVGTRAVERLTHQEFTPNTGTGDWDESNPVDPGGGKNRLGYGILNLGPCPLPGGRVAFTSNRNGYVPPKGFTNPTLQLHVMDEDGSNVTPIAPMSIGSALHPTPLADGRLMFSSYESQGLRDSRLWGIWSIWPDGRLWAPVVSAFRPGQAFHFMTQVTGGDLVVVDYYNLNNNGFGALYRMPVRPPAGTAPFHPADPAQNPSIEQTIGAGFSWPFRMPFTPYGLRSITPFTHGNDEAAPVGSGGRVGKFTHPSAAPDGDLLVVWTPGPANDLDRPAPTPYYDAGIYVVRGGETLSGPGDLVLVKNDPDWNEAWPRAVVPWSAIHGAASPPDLPWLPNDGSVHPMLPAGTPYGLVGTSSLYNRESFPGLVSPWGNTFDGLDAFNTAENEQSGNWVTQGAEAGRSTSADVHAVRILVMEPNASRSYGPHEGLHFRNHANERMRILAEIPVRKPGDPPDPQGNPDTSFLARIPADTPFTFQTLDRDGLVLQMAQTWHQVRPGEMRADCGGCHAHSREPLRFEDTLAALPGYRVWDVAESTPLLSKDASGETVVVSRPRGPVDVEFHRDVRPILERSCVACHTQADATPPGNLVLDDRAETGGLPGDYARLADDSEARWGHPPLVSSGWRQTNASRYVRAMQARRSLLVWKVFGRRLDGWTNEDHPTESTPGDPSTLPPGAAANEADLDFTGSIMPPPGTAPALSEDEKMTIARWVDLGCPIDSARDDGNDGHGWFLDDGKPTLEVSLPRAGRNPAPLSSIVVGVADANSGIAPGSLSVRADRPINGRAAGVDLADLASAGAEGILSIALSPPLGAGSAGTLFVEVRDVEGNVTRVARRYRVE